VGHSPKRNRRREIDAQIGVACKLVSHVRGIVEVDSEVGRGSRFVVSLVVPPASSENKSSSPVKDTARVSAMAQVDAWTRMLLAEDQGMMPDIES